MNGKGIQWFRLFASLIDNEAIRLLAFEDRWHYVALHCLKAQGVLDAGDEPAMLQRKVGVKLGLQLRELEAAAARLDELGLIDADSFQPADWNSQQFASVTDPTAAARMRRYRENKKKQKQEVGGVTGTLPVTPVTVTGAYTNTNTEKETTTAPVTLDWSANGLEAYVGEDRGVVVGLLNGHSQQVQQAILDEFAGHIEDKAVKNSPMGLLAKLVAEAHEGGFKLNRGRRIRDARIARAVPVTKRAPGGNTESPYENAINFARQRFGPDAPEPNESAFNREISEAARRWPEEAKKSSVEALTYGKRDGRKQSKQNLPTTQGAAP